MESNSEDVLRPTATMLEVMDRIKDNYFLEEPMKWTQLDGYDDKNYKVETPNGIFICKLMNGQDSKNVMIIEAQHKMMFHLSAEGFNVPTPLKNKLNKYYSLEVFHSKEMNRWLGHADRKFYRWRSENQLICSLQCSGILVGICVFHSSSSLLTPTPFLSNNSNSPVCLPYLENDGESPAHALRLLKYQNGHKLNDAKPKKRLYFNVGAFTAKVDEALQGLYLKEFENYVPRWSLLNVASVLDVVGVVSETRQELVRRHVQNFINRVLPRINDLETGIIHGDMNEHNILVDGDKVVALLDFGDSHVAPYLFEAAMCLAYVFIHSKTLEFFDDFLEGYSIHRKLTPLEADLLQICICARLCQSLVLGAYSALSDPNNSYILSTQAQGWAILEKLSNAQLNVTKFVDL